MLELYAKEYYKICDNGVIFAENRNEVQFLLSDTFARKYFAGDEMAVLIEGGGRSNGNQGYFSVDKIELAEKVLQKHGFRRTN
jgi:hypothetical protein